VFLPNGDVVYAQVERRGSTSGFINVWAVASGSAFNNTEGERRTSAANFIPLVPVYTCPSD